jgi:carbamoyl-phosphate synthase large subunit
MIPPNRVSVGMHKEMMRAAKELAAKLDVKGLMNCQFAIKDEQLYVIEVNPRASRTVPFVSKSIGVPLAKLAAKVMSGCKLKDLGFTKEVVPPYYTVKEAVFPWNRFPGIDVVLGPEMHSTGEVMGIDTDPEVAYLKSQISAFNALPKEGLVFISVNDRDKHMVTDIARTIAKAGFDICATKGTMIHLLQNGIECERAYKVHERRRPDIVDRIKNGDIVFVINTPGSHDAREDEVSIRAAAVSSNISYATDLSSARACAAAMLHAKNKETTVRTLQEYHAEAAAEYEN